MTLVANEVRDLAGNSNAESTQAFTYSPAQDEPEDVTDRVTINLYGRQYNRRSGVYGFYAAITNNSTDALAYPIRLSLTELGPAGTTVLNASGTLVDGTPYYDFEGTGSLAAGQTTAAVVIGIQPPSRTLYTFVPRVSAVVIGGGTGGELVWVAADSLASLPMPSFQNMQRPLRRQRRRKSIGTRCAERRRSPDSRIGHDRGRFGSGDRR